MMMKRLIASSVLLVAAGLTSAVAHEHGATKTSETSAESFEMIQLSCWELLALPDEDADYAFTLLYGYAAGERGNPVLNVAAAEQVITRAIAMCVEDPDLPVIDAFAISWTN